MTQFDAIFVGAGPRAVATVLRLVARLRADAGQQGAAGAADPGAASAPVRIALIDAVEIAAGATWRTDQPAEYLNNTTVAATTLHPDASTVMSGPAAPGPTLVDWLAGLQAGDGHPFADWVARDAAGLTPADFSSRRLQGVYYRDQLDAAIASGLVEVTEVLGTAVDMVGSGDMRRVLLADGSVLTAPTVVLAQGMVQSLPGLEVQALASAAAEHALIYIAPGMPAEQPWEFVLGDRLSPGETVLVRGLGANFFDVVGHLSRQWGGTFEPVLGDPAGRMRYVPGGREPRIVAGSRRGIPYRSKPDGDAPQPAFEARFATPDWFASLSGFTGLSLLHEVWPVLASEFAWAYLSALEEWEPAATAGGWRERLAGAQTLPGVEQVLSDAITDARWAWQVGWLRRPTGGAVVSAEEWSALTQQLVEDELDSMTWPARHPRAAVNRAMSGLRGQVSKLGVTGVLSGDSNVHDLHGWFDGDALFLASGPPSSRVREVLALVEAGVVSLIGPEAAVEVSADGFRLFSPVTGQSETARVLVETRMSKGKVPATNDPLLRALLDTGRARIHAVDGVPTASLEATGAVIDEAVPHGFNLIDAAGNADAAVIVLGIPAQSTQPGSAIGATPGKPSPLLAGADVAAKQILLRR